MTSEEFTLKLKEVVQEKQLSEKDIARSSGASRPAIQHWLAGLTTPHPALYECILQDLWSIKK